MQCRTRSLMYCRQYDDRTLEQTPDFGRFIWGAWENKKTCSVNAASWFRSVKSSPTYPVRSRRSAKPHHQRGEASPLPIRCTSLFQSAKRTPAGVSWRG